MERAGFRPRVGHRLKSFPGRRNALPQMKGRKPEIRVVAVVLRPGRPRQCHVVSAQSPVLLERARTVAFMDQAMRRMARVAAGPGHGGHHRTAGAFEPLEESPGAGVHRGEDTLPAIGSDGLVAHALQLIDSGALHPRDAHVHQARDFLRFHRETLP